MGDRADRFFAWFSKIGGYVTPAYEELIDKRLYASNYISHSFKEKAAEVKEKYNYKFEEKPPVEDNFLEGFDKVNNINFDKK